MAKYLIVTEIIYQYKQLSVTNFEVYVLVLYSFHYTSLSP